MTDLLLRRVFALRQASRGRPMTGKNRIRRRVYDSRRRRAVIDPERDGGDPAFPRTDAARAPDVAASACLAIHQNSRSWPTINRSSAVRLSFCRHPSGKCSTAYFLVRALLLCGKGETAGEKIGGSMATIALTDVRPNRDSFAEDRLGPPAELWAAPPLAPIEDEDAFHPSEPRNLSETFGSRRQLIAGTAIVAALGAAVLTYFFLASPGAKAPAETSPIASSPTAVKSSSKTQVQPAPTVAEPSPGASVWFLRPTLLLRSPPRLRPKLVP